MTDFGWINATTPDKPYICVASAPELGIIVATQQNNSTLAGAQNMITSSDGLTWTPITTPPTIQSNAWGALTWSPELGLFAALTTGNGTSNMVLTSPDGLNWTFRPPGEAAAHTLPSMVWSPQRGRFQAVGNVSGAGVTIQSTDGVNWSITFLVGSLNRSWQNIIWVADLGLFIACADNGASGRIMTSPDGVTWTSREAVAALSWSKLAYGNGRIVCTSGTGPNGVMYSVDGINWVQGTIAAQLSSSLMWSSHYQLFIGIDTLGNVYTSPNGATWTSEGSVPITSTAWQFLHHSLVANRLIAVSPSAGATTSRVLLSAIITPPVSVTGPNCDFEAYPSGNCSDTESYGSEGVAIPWGSQRLNISPTTPVPNGHSLALDPANPYLWILIPGGERLVKVNTTTRTIALNTTVAANLSFALDVHPSNGSLYAVQRIAAGNYVVLNLDPTTLATLNTSADINDAEMSLYVNSNGVYLLINHAAVNDDVWMTRLSLDLQTVHYETYLDDWEGAGSGIDGRTEDFQVVADSAGNGWAYNKHKLYKVSPTGTKTTYNLTAHLTTADAFQSIIYDKDNNLFLLGYSNNISYVPGRTFSFLLFDPVTATVIGSYTDNTLSGHIAYNVANTNRRSVACNGACWLYQHGHMEASPFNMVTNRVLFDIPGLYIRKRYPMNNWGYSLPPADLSRYLEHLYINDPPALWVRVEELSGADQLGVLWLDLPADSPLTCTDEVVVNCNVEPYPSGVCSDFEVY